jgi:hypothetical protein
LNPLTLQIKIGSFEVAHWIELRKVAEFIHDEFEKRPFDFFVKFWKLVCLLILIGYFIWFSALLCCWSCWCIDEEIDELNCVDIKFSCVDLRYSNVLKNCFSLMHYSMFLMLTPSWKFVNLLMFWMLIFVSSYNKRLTNLRNSSELVDIVLC